MAGGSNPPSATNPTPLDELGDLVAAGTRRLAVPDEAVLVLAVSGGPDSTALLHGAAQAAAARGWRLRVAHLDHGLRPDSADDATFVTDAAAALDLACEVRHADVAALARAEGRSIEDAGREARYRFLDEIAPEGAFIVTAHTADDAAETVLINLLRGSGLTGVRGMPARRGRIVRPLLTRRRGTLRALLDAGGIAYRLDPSNDDPSHLRNRVRGELLPLLEELRPGAVNRIGQFARLAADDDELLNAMAAAELTRRTTMQGSIDWHDAPQPTLGRRVLRLAIGEPAASAERVAALLEAAAGERGGITIELGAGRVASVNERQIRIGRP